MAGHRAPEREFLAQFLAKRGRRELHGVSAFAHQTPLHRLRRRRLVDGAMEPLHNACRPSLPPPPAWWRGGGGPSTMAAGVFAGASTPHHVLTSKLAMPASAIVGTPGNSGERCALVTASTGSLPSRTNGRMVGTVEKNRSTRPDSNSTVAGLLPLNGTCVICKPAFWRNISPAR